jgi:hypothetical protein
VLAPTELRRVLAEWQTRLKRVHAILQPPEWNESEWCRFAQALTLLTQKHGTTWTTPPLQTWDLRWQMREGGELVCQVEQADENAVTLIVAQSEGFAGPGRSYTWLWAEFGRDGRFRKQPYWVEGSWKEALMGLLVPFQYQNNFLLESRAATPSSLLLGRSEPPAS